MLTEKPAALDEGALKKNGEWFWWAGADEEWMSVGPCKSKEDAISEAVSERIGEYEDEDGIWRLAFQVCEARQDPLLMSDWIDTSEIIERADERLSDSDRVACEHDEGPWFDPTPEQKKDLRERITKAVDEWQAAHNIVVTCKTFSASRNHETINMIAPEIPDHG